jgi:hypothetical protein
MLGEQFSSTQHTYLFEQIMFLKQMVICCLWRAGDKSENGGCSGGARPAICKTFHTGAVISRSDELLLLHALVFLSILLSDDWMMQLADRAKKGGQSNLAELDAKFIAHGWLFWQRLLAQTLKICQPS